MCIHLWNVDPPNRERAFGKWEKCGEERLFDGIFPPREYNWRKPIPEKHKPKMSQVDRDIGGMLEGLPRAERV